MDRLLEFAIEHGISRTDKTMEHLTPKQLVVMELVAEGLSNKEIAEKLFIAEKTVKNHIQAIFLKIEAKNRTQVAKYYYENLKPKE